MTFRFRRCLQIVMVWIILAPAVLEAGTPSQPNVIVVSCDNLGFGDTEPFGAAQHRTPHLKRMAREGRVFTHFYVTSGVCTSSRASLMTGCYAQRVGMHDNPRDGQVLRPVSPYGLHPDEVTIAEALKPRGYATGIIGKWHLGDQDAFLPTNQGFDWFLGIPYSDDMTAETGLRVSARIDGAVWPPLPLMQNMTVIEAPVDRNTLTQRYTRAALEFIEQHRDEPFFLYLPQAMPGSTKEPFASEAFKGKSKNGPWGDSIEELDWSQGMILDKLVELEIDDSTLVIWTSDNGAPSRGAPSRGAPSRGASNKRGDISRGSNSPLHGRGYTTGEGGFRVPMIAWWPGKIPAGTTCNELSTTMDILPTLVRLAGGSPPLERQIDGYDIRSLLFDKSDAKSPYEVFYYYERDQLQAVRSGPWKLFLPLKSFTKHPHFSVGEKSTTLLFNVVEDIGSKRNVAAEHSKIVEQLTRMADKGRSDLGDRGQQGTGMRPVGYHPNPKPRVLP